MKQYVYDEKLEDFLDEIEEAEEEEQEVADEVEDEADADEDLDPLAKADMEAAAEEDPEGDDDEPTSEEEAEESADEGESEDQEQEGEEVPEGTEDEAGEADAGGEEATSTSAEPERDVIQYATGTVEDVNQKLDGVFDKQEALIAKRESVEDKWEDGDLERSEMRQQLKELRAEERRLADEERDLKNERDQIQRQAKEADHYWRIDSQRFLAANPDYAASEILRNAMNLKITSLAQNAEWQGRSNTDMLAEAKRLVDEELGRSSPEDKETNKEPSGKDAAEAKRKAIEGRQVKKKVPKTLGDLPPAEQADTGNAFAKLDALDGPDYEEALAGLSARELQRYLSQQ